MQLRCCQSVRGELAREEILLGNLTFLVGGIAGEFQRLHPVAQGNGYRVQLVRRSDKHHFGQIERDIEVVVGEGVILLRIQHFEQGGTRVAAKIRAEFVNLIKHEDRIVGCRCAEPFQNAPRH